MAPHVVEPGEVRVVVLASVGVVPEADRHRRKGADADELALLADDAPSVVVEGVHIEPEPQALDLAAVDRDGGVAHHEAGDDVGAAADRGEADVALDGPVDEVEALRNEGRAGGQDRLELREVVGPRRGKARLLDGVDVLGGGAEGLDALLRHVVEERVAVGMKRRAVVERERRPARQRAHLPVPHHPAAGREIEDAFTALHVAVQGQLLDVLQKRPARAVHDALRGAGGAGRVHDVERVVEREAFEFNRGGGLARGELVEGDGLLHRGEVGRGGGVRHHHDAFDRRDPRRHRCQPAYGVEPLAAVEVAVGAEQHLRPDLPEPVHHPLHAEVRRGGRPDRADAGGSEHGDHGFRHVGHVAGDAVARRHSGRPQALSDHGDGVVKLAEAQRVSHPILAAEQDRRRVVAAAEQVLREVEACAGEPLRARHPVSVDEHRPVAAIADDLPVRPNR